MRFALEFLLSGNVIPLDYRRYFVSFLKDSFQKHDAGWFEKMYQHEDPIKKPFTFSVFLGRAEFGRYDIRLENAKVILNYSAFDYDYGINFYNSILKSRDVSYPFGKANEITLKNFRLVKENTIYTDSIMVNTLSPLLAREHDRNTNLDKYYLCDEAGFAKAIRENIRQNCEGFIDFRKEDIEEIEIKPVEVRRAKILHYEHKIDGNIGTFNLCGKPYLLDFLVKSGMGARRSQGFGMLEVRG